MFGRLTTTVNDLVKPVHDRMPVIGPRASYAEWLDQETPEKRLLELLKPYPADAMRVVEVGHAVNSPRNDGPGATKQRESTSIAALVGALVVEVLELRLAGQHGVNGPEEPVEVEREAVALLLRELRLHDVACLGPVGADLRER